jgi:anaerobic ribonucleoside-triphosphate reductase activating protein
MPHLRVGARVPVTRAEGPGARFALWVSGCSLRCPGCCNPHLFAPDGAPIAAAALVAEVAAVRAEIEGLTVLGGEPFEQAPALAEVCAGVRALGLSVIVFSGFSREELALRPDAGPLLATLDVLVDGRYDARQPERTRRWVGSENQRFHYLTDRYSPAIELPPPGEPCDTVELTLPLDGTLRHNGWPVTLSLTAQKH